MADLQPTRETTPLRRRARPVEGTLAVGALIVISATIAAAYLDSTRPAHTAAVLGLMAFAVLVAVWSLRHGWRSDAERYPRLCTLEPLDARRLLRRELRRGRPGPVELRPFARAWVVHQLRRTGNPPVLICLAAWYLALFDLTDNAPMLLLGGAILALLALAAAQLVLQHRAAQVADAVEAAEGTGPHGQVSA